jgi:hypothetical protein
VFLVFLCAIDTVSLQRYSFLSGNLKIFSFLFFIIFFGDYKLLNSSFILHFDEKKKQFAKKFFKDDYSIIIYFTIFKLA